MLGSACSTRHSPAPAGAAEQRAPRSHTHLCSRCCGASEGVEVAVEINRAQINTTSVSCLFPAEFPGGSEAELCAGGDARGEGRTVGVSRGVPHDAQPASLGIACGVRALHEGLARERRGYCAHQDTLVPAHLVDSGLQTFTSLPNLAEEMELTTAVSPSACGSARAGSILPVDRAGDNAHLQAPATVSISHISSPGVNLESWHLHYHSFNLGAFLHSSCTVRSVPGSLGIPV